MPFQASSRIGDLLMMRGNARADTELRRGNAWSQGIQDIAGTLSSTIGEIARMKADAPRKRAEALQLEDMERKVMTARRQDQDKVLIRDLETKFTDPQMGRVNGRGVIGELRAAGRPDLAGPYEDTMKQRLYEGLTDHATRLNQLKTPFGRGEEMLRTVQDQPDLYPLMLTQFRDLAGGVHPDLVNAFPDAYDPERVKQALEFTTKTLSTLDARERAIKGLLETEKANLGQMERDKQYRENLGGYLRTVDTPEEHAQAIATARDMGIPDRIVEPWATWDDTLPKRIDEELLMTPKERREEAAKKPGHMDGTGPLALTYNKLYDIEQSRQGGRPLSDAAQKRILDQARQQPETGATLRPEDALNIKAVLANPKKYDTLDADHRSRIMGQLFAEGFQFPDDDSYQDGRDRRDYNDYKESFKTYYDEVARLDLLSSGSQKARPIVPSYQKWKTDGKPDFTDPTKPKPAAASSAVVTPPVSAGLVWMRAPDGTESQVPATLVEYYKNLGATILPKK